jgi:FMN reductase
VSVDGIRRDGGEAVWADRWIRRLPFHGAHDPGDPLLREFLAAAASARGFLWGSPEYHGTCSGLLKNALDFLSFEQTEGKWVAFLATAGGRQGAQSTLITLRTVARALHLWTLPEQVSVASSHRAMGPDGRFLESELESKLLALGSDLVSAIGRFSPSGAAPAV